MTRPTYTTGTDRRRRRPGPRRARRVLAVLTVAALLAGCAGDADEEEAAESPDAAPEAPADDAPEPDEEPGEALDEVDDADAAPAASGEAPRADVPVYPGAELVHEQVLEAAVEEVWAVDAPLDDVLEFYATMSGLEALSDSAMAGDDDGGYLELEIFSLVRDGVTDRAAYEAAVAEAEYGPLLRVAVLPVDAQMLAWFGGEAGREAAPPDSTVIVFGVLTG